LYQGKKVWEGNKDNILETQEPALKEFLFCSQLIREMRK
jgi:phospholipid/cholesterol/gamma-HCH transport system ATP-binding protein